MRRRCLSERAPGYKYYGGRGITICGRWLSFDNFLADMGERPVGMTLDRIDPNGNYEPGNCRWADMKTQSNNWRNSRNRISAILDDAICSVGSAPDAPTRESVIAMLERLRHDFCG